MKKKHQSSLILSILITLLTLYIVNSSLVTTGVIEYTKLFFTKLFPTSFLLFTFSSLLINYKLIEILSSLLKSNSAPFYITIMSMISGFPSGPKYTKELLEKGYIDKNTGEHLLKFTHFPNPLFILGPVNTLLKENSITTKLLLSLILSNLLISFLPHKKTPLSTLPKNEQLPFPKALNQAIYASLKTIILIYGTSLFFFLISLLITHYINLSPITYVIINGIFDLTKGIFSTTLLSSTILKAILIICFVSFGSLSIHIQIKSILSDTTLNYKTFLKGRIISTILSIIIFFFLLLI